MTKWLVAAAAIVIVAMPVASAASPSQDKPKPATTAQAQSAEGEAEKACKAERNSLGAEAFSKKYGTNHNKRNAFGKCVSGKSKGKKDDQDAKDDDDKDDGAAAKACRAERASIGVEAFAKKHGTNHNLKNAFGKCVSGKSK
jgi:Flp pilus assembly protein TadD